MIRNMKTYLLVTVGKDDVEKSYQFHGENALSMTKDKAKLYEAEDDCFCEIFEVKFPPVYQTKYEKK